MYLPKFKWTYWWDRRWKDTCYHCGKKTSFTLCANVDQGIFIVHLRCRKEFHKKCVLQCRKSFWGIWCFTCGRVLRIKDWIKIIHYWLEYKYGIVSKEMHK